MTSTDTPAPSPRAGRSRHRVRRWVLAVVGLVVVVFAVAIVWVGLDALKAQASLSAASDSVEILRGQVIAGDEPGAAGTLEVLQSQTAEAQAATHGPHWWLVAHTPGIGPTVAAVQTVSEVVDGLALDALPALADATKILDPGVLAPQNGRIDLGPLIDVAPQVITADDAVQAASDRLGAVDTSRVYPLVAGPVEDLSAMVDDVAMTTATASRAVQLMPSMLGAYGQRKYVLFAQNNAELRATGGIPGAWLLVTVDNGQITIGDRNPAPTSSQPVLPITEEEDLLFTDRLVTYGQNVNLTPDFPRSAEVAQAMWAATREGERVDGVISVDPITLQHVLGATGPVTLPSGEVLDGENAARVLLNEIYVEVADPSAQDAIFGDAAQAAFDALIGGGNDVRATIGALTTSADEGRLMLWSADPTEQALIAGTVLSGELRGDNDGAPVVGVYLNDSSATKMGYYLDYSVDVTQTSCFADGTRALRVRVDMTSTAPPEVVDYPPYISGGGWLPPGSVATNVMVYSPTGGRVESARRDGVDTDEVGFYSHEGMDVGVTSVTLAPGESQSLEFDLVTGPDQPLPTLVRVTPGARTANVVIEDSPC